MTIASEEWRTTTVRRYEVSSHGRLRNGAGRVLLPWVHRSGHLYVNLGRGVRCQLHRLVLMAFIGPQPKGCECLHIDGNPINNRADNLRWGTRLDNIIDTVRHTGRTSRSLLTYAQAAEIRRRCDGRHGCQARLAREFSVSESVVSGIVLGQTYAMAL